MEESKLSATYLINDTMVLKLEEQGLEGVAYVLFDKNNYELMDKDILSWEEMNDSSIKGVLSCARALALKANGLNNPMPTVELLNEQDYADVTFEADLDDELEM